MEFQERNYNTQKQIELDYWIDKPLNSLTTLDDDKLENLIHQHKSFTHSNVVALLNLFLTTKFPVNEEYIKKIIDPAFDERQQFKGESKKPLGQEVFELKGVLEQKFKNKYMKDLYSVRRTMLEKWRAKDAHDDDEDEGEVEVRENNNLDDDEVKESPATQNCKETLQY